MKKILLGLATTAFAAMFSASVFACDTASGALTKVDTGKNAVIMKGECCGSEMTFTLKKETKITLNGKEVKLADLKSGDKLQINYEKMDDVLSIVATRNS